MNEVKYKRNERLPEWLRKPFSGGRSRAGVRALIRRLGLHTVCESANCPNLCECWQRRAATFLLLGDTCTRNCRFCAVSHGVPAPVDAAEPGRIAAAISELGLCFAVLTCVTRDDLDDGGALSIAATIRAVRERNPEIGIEVLTSDFNGSRSALQHVLAAGPDVFNHNLETTERLTPRIRNRADYRRSLDILAAAAEAGNEQLLIKSGFMLGLGEEDGEIRQMLQDLRRHGVQILTIGQYLAPSSRHWPVARYIPPDEFADLERLAVQEYGFAYVVSGPLVRSSYKAGDAVSALRGTHSSSR
jgi:lipoic acid synthetase